MSSLPVPLSPEIMIGELDCATCSTSFSTLIIAPLLHAVVGKWALLYVSIIVAVAYAIGTVIRFNIKHLEPKLAGGEYPSLQVIDRVGSVILSGAYIISVAFYTRLLSAFVLNSFGVVNPTAANGLTTVILIFIAAIGFAAIHDF